MFLPIKKSCYKLLRLIYNNPGIKVSELLKKAKVSQRVGYKHLESLIKIEVINENKANGLRSLYPNLSTRAGQSIFSLMELEFEYELLNMYPELKESLILLRGNASKLGIKSLVLFGEFVKLRSKETSMDLLVITELSDHGLMLQFLKKCFSTVTNPVRARITSPKGFIELKNNNPSVFKGLFKNHVCVLNTQEFLKLSS